VCCLTSRCCAAVSQLDVLYHGMIDCDAGSLFAHAGIFAGRHGLCDVCTLSSRARKVDSQLITRKSGRKGRASCEECGLSLVSYNSMGSS
jgi:hypothetical protein